MQFQILPSLVNTAAAYFPDTGFLYWTISRNGNTANIASADFRPGQSSAICELETLSNNILSYKIVMRYVHQTNMAQCFFEQM